MDSDRCPPSGNRETVYYDGSCPLCSREIAFYRSVRGADQINWQDVSAQTDDRVADDLGRSTAMARFHLRKSDGSLVSGAAAFGHLWAALPAFRLVGRVALLPPVTFLLEGLYRIFLPVRGAVIKCLRAPNEG
jgi:predicted DCC family thiol-disulfide oxidoreductase YuxK